MRPRQMAQEIASRPVVEWGTLLERVPDEFQAMVRKHLEIQRARDGMKDYQVTKHNLREVMQEIEAELDDSAILLVTTQNPRVGKWGMAKLWRAWMATTADWMARQGATMPLCYDKQGKPYGSRAFNENDAHELFTCQWLGVDRDGTRLSWSKTGRDGMRPATKGERFIAMQKHEAWATERGINLFQPRDSEYADMQKEAA